MSQDKPKLNNQAALMTGSTGPVLLLCLLALGGVKITLWMILLAVGATFAMLISAGLRAARPPSSKKPAGKEDVAPLAPTDRA